MRERELGTVAMPRVVRLADVAGIVEQRDHEPHERALRSEALLRPVRALVAHEQPLTPALSQFLGDRSLTSESPGERRVLQEALAQLTVREIEGVLRSELPDRFGPAFVADGARFEHLRASMELLGRLAFDGKLSQASRMKLYESLRGVIASYPGLLRKEVRVDPDVHPGLAAIRAQLYKNLQDLLVSFDAGRFIADTGFWGDYAELVRNHGVLVLDNSGLDSR